MSPDKRLQRTREVYDPERVDVDWRDIIGSCARVFDVVTDPQTGITRQVPRLQTFTPRQTR